MYIRGGLPRLAGVAVVAFWGSTASIDAQSGQGAPAPPADEHAAQTGDEHAIHDMGAMVRDGSGTAWLPDASPMYAIHRQKGAWTLMAHENVFVQFLHESGSRGDDQVGSINWVMGMAGRTVGTGHLAFRGMFSVEPWTIRGCGYPDLLASGEECQGEKIHDRQHPHDLPMEIAVQYDAPIAGAVRWQVYVGAAGEPALGPVAYPHRVSAMPNPVAPMTHHWFDATHVSFGVVSGGMYGKRWKAETSVFNGREPDEHRTDFDFGALDSVSGRLWFLPTANFAFQVSAGRLTEAEAAEDGGARIGVTRATASGTYHTVFRDNSIWATTVAWGRNAEPGRATNALLLETNLTFDDRNTWFGRFEVAGKTAHDLDVRAVSDAFTVAKLQGGYTRYLDALGGFTPGLGATLSAGFVPKELEAVYGSRANIGFGVFATLRPAATPAAAAVAGQTGRTMVMTAIDPATLMCPAPVAATTASKTVYNGTTYYFCSDSDRDVFLKDPAMNVAMMRKP
jgi:YHS domain-containing protein